MWVTYLGQNSRGFSFSANLFLAHADNHVDVQQGGTQYDADVTMRKSVKGNGFYAIDLALEHRDAVRRDYSYSQASFRLSRQVDLRGGYSVNASVYGEWFLQGAPTPGFAVRRVGHEYGFAVSVEKTNKILLNRYIPYVSFRASRHNSSISAFAFAFRDIGMQVGVQSLF